MTCGKGRRAQATFTDIFPFPWSESCVFRKNKHRVLQGRKAVDEQEEEGVVVVVGGWDRFSWKNEAIVYVVIESTSAFLFRMGLGGCSLLVLQQQLLGLHNFCNIAKFCLLPYFNIVIPVDSTNFKTDDFRALSFEIFYIVLMCN